jgi:hypothetical protein
LLFILFYTFFYWIFSSILPLIIWFHLVLYQIRFLFFICCLSFFILFPKNFLISSLSVDLKLFLYQIYFNCYFFCFAFFSVSSLSILLIWNVASIFVRVCFLWG